MRQAKVSLMTSDEKVNLNYKLRSLPNGEFYFLLVGLEEPNTDKRLSMNLTEAEVREFYREKWGYSDSEIDDRLRIAREHPADVANA
jgi:hypothetical protein